MRVIITSDFFRSPTVTHRNIHRLAHVLREPIEAATGQSVHVYYPNPANPQLWPILFERRMNRACFPQLYEEIEKQKGDVFLVFECPPIMRYAFDDLNITYINITVHPIRFGPDLFLGMESNDWNTEIRIRNSDWSNSATTFRSLAQQRKEKSNQRPIEKLRGAAVFFAQCERDSTLIEKGRFLTWYDIATELVARVGDRPFYVQPHPSQPRNAFVRAALDSGASLTGLNTYSLFESETEFLPITINSSVAAEAAAFGLYPCCLRRPVSAGTAISYGFNRSKFWAEILGIKEKRGFWRRDYRPNQLREVFNAWWSFPKP